MDVPSGQELVKSAVSHPYTTEYGSCSYRRLNGGTAVGWA